MSKTVTCIVLSVLIYCLTSGAGKAQENKSTELGNSWELEKRVTKQVDNLHFTFPAEGYAYENRDLLVKECIDAIKEMSAKIKVPTYSNPIRFTFLDSRQEMEEEVGMEASGWTNMWTREIHIVASTKFSPPIKHEVLHMIAMTTWGYPQEDLVWINEGLATTTETHCNGYTVGELYRYFVENDMLISINSLTNDFHGEPSIISYHQSAHIVDYLLSNYGLDKFIELWKKGFSFFEEIYLISFAQMEEELSKQTIEEYPTPVSIDWDVFREGCF